MAGTLQAMCLIFVAVDAHPKYPTIIAANRDEFYDRPTAPASFWPDLPELLAGRDLRAGGTWLGITKTGRIAALTNHRDPELNQEDAPSRGRLVPEFLMGQELPKPYLEKLSRRAHVYNGFNLLTCQDGEFYWYSNRGGEIRKLSSGIHGLSNHLLDTPWPKVENGKNEIRRILFQAEISTDDLFSVLANRTIIQDASLPDTGVGLEWERILSPIFIASPTYGTRSSTVILIERSGRTTFLERSFQNGAEEYSTARYQFLLSARSASGF
jgi:uncharacterized protein with NRDE domain